MVIALVVVAGLAGAFAWSETRRWWTGGRVLARLGTPTPTRLAPPASSDPLVFGGRGVRTTHERGMGAAPGPSYRRS